MAMILLAAAAVTVVATAAGCPSGCTCKWKGGKQTVECVNKSLPAIPAGMDAGTQVLDVSGNPLDALARGRFAAVGLSNLQKIFAARCRITYVDDAAFQGLSNLVELDLSDNGIAEVPTKSFDDYPQLMKLVLGGNAVTVVRTAAFKRLAYLTVLDLSRCRLTTVEPGAFDGLLKLEWLRLDHNRIARIEGSGGGAVLPLSLHGIEMHDNPWLCDCRLRDVHRWLNNNTAPHTVEPSCHSPERLRGTSVRKLNAEELACAPDATNASPTYAETDAGKNVTLSCRITPAGEARVSWWFEGRPVPANGTTSVATATVDGAQLLFVEDAGAADNGTYTCVAENKAGRASCNFTVRVVQTPSEMAAGSYPPDAPAPALLLIVLAAGSVCFVAVAVVCAVSCRLLVVKRRRRYAGRPDDKADEGGDGGGAGGQSSKPASSDIRQSDSVNLTVSSTVDGKLSSAEDVSVYGEYDATGGPVADGAYEVHQVMHMAGGGGGGYDAYHTTASHGLGTTLEANPDLISDASTVVKDNGGGGGGDYHHDGREVYKLAVPPPPGGREFWSAGAVPPMATAIYPSSSYELQLSPGKLAAGEPYPPDYGLPKLQSTAVAAYPPDYGLPKLSVNVGGAAYPAPPSLYRTLPHRRNAAKPQGRSSQEAEFVLLQQHHHHHHHHPMRYEPQMNVRYNQQGYPYPVAGPPDGAYYAATAATFYDPPPSLSNASAQTLDEETMIMMTAIPVAAAITLPPQPPQPPSRQQPTTATEHLHKAVTSVQKQPPNTESPDEGYVGEGPDS